LSEEWGVENKVVCPARTTAWICNWLMFVCQATLTQNLMLADVLL